ncbi:MAG: hypothetical protein Q9220_007569 [cf. Caloplaca sp. 1 TL-2023]
MNSPLSTDMLGKSDDLTQMPPLEFNRAQTWPDNHEVDYSDQVHPNEPRSLSFLSEGANSGMTKARYLPLPKSAELATSELEDIGPPLLPGTVESVKGATEEARSSSLSTSAEVVTGERGQKESHSLPSIPESPGFEAGPLPYPQATKNPKDNRVGQTNLLVHSPRPCARRTFKDLRTPEDNLVGRREKEPETDDHSDPRARVLHQTAIELRKTVLDREERFDSRFAKLEERFDSKFAKLEERFDSKFATLEERFDSKFAKLEEGYNSKFATLEEQFNSKFAPLEEQFNSILATFEEQFKSNFVKLRGQFDWNFAQLENHFVFKFAELEDRYSKELAELRAAVNDLIAIIKELRPSHDRLEATVKAMDAHLKPSENLLREANVSEPTNQGQSWRVPAFFQALPGMWPKTASDAPTEVVNVRPTSSRQEASSRILPQEAAELSADKPPPVDPKPQPTILNRGLTSQVRQSQFLATATRTSEPPSARSGSSIRTSRIFDDTINQPAAFPINIPKSTTREASETTSIPETPSIYIRQPGERSRESRPRVYKIPKTQVWDN